MNTRTDGYDIKCIPGRCIDGYLKLQQGSGTTHLPVVVMSQDYVRHSRNSRRFNDQVHFLANAVTRFFR